MKESIPESNYSQMAYFALERDFKESAWLPVLREYFPVILVMFVLYVSGLYAGQKYMERRNPFNLRPVLVLWNMSIVIFSAICTMR